MLRDDVENLAAHFRAYGESRLADALDGTLDGPEDRLPRRVLAMFTHGMGGLMDTPCTPTDESMPLPPSSATSSLTPSTSRHEPP
jgi:hypothetical protein